MLSFLFGLAVLRVLVVSALDSVCPYDACVSVTNFCGAPLYVQRTNIDGDENTPSSVAKIKDAEELILDISPWGSAQTGQRLYAWWSDPMTNQLDPLKARDKVEINYCFTSPQDTMCYNPTAVDYFALPAYVGPYDDTDCPSTEHSTTGFGDIRVSQVAEQCPTRFDALEPFGVCLSPHFLCTSDPTNEMCSFFDDIIKVCVNDGNCPRNITTDDVWGCANEFAPFPEYCAAIHRGLYFNVTDGDTQQDFESFYKHEPFNPYAAFIHQSYAKIYAFPYDDYQGGDQSGYKQCTTNFMKVVWCPQDGVNRTASAAVTLEPVETTATTAVTSMEPNETTAATATPAPTILSDGVSTGWDLVYSPSGQRVSSSQLAAGYEDDFYFAADIVTTAFFVAAHRNLTQVMLRQNMRWNLDDGLQQISGNFKVDAAQTTYGIIKIQETFAADGALLNFVKFQSDVVYAMVATTDDGIGQKEYHLADVAFDMYFTLKLAFVDGSLKMYVNDELKATHDLSFWTHTNHYMQIGNNLQIECCDFQSMVYMIGLETVESIPYNATSGSGSGSGGGKSKTKLSSKGSLSEGGVLGIVFGTFFGVVVIAIVIICVHHHRTKDDKSDGLLNNDYQKQQDVEEAL
eukprot:CAMPEP_0202688970 /NCGR_PEP_ID=MMETSP1385-20130828/4349_1 /ASSEMBLY_ACC=CAM_ASM_000861 /TAXON_ID=933848 /ORGANISM="Elphidium margaritaceum" /LENGTH=628 /DNA_ID=CAMNT_0049344041 /DNA_START=21 /DNA_END=1907 /DNA_ORIENTATION=+